MNETVNSYYVRGRRSYYDAWGRLVYEPGPWHLAERLTTRCGRSVQHIRGRETPNYRKDWPEGHRCADCNAGRRASAHRQGLDLDVGEVCWDSPYALECGPRI